MKGWRSPMARAAHHENVQVLAAALQSASREKGGLTKGATVVFPHRTHGEPPLAAVLAHGPDIVTIGGVADGRAFTLDPDRSTEALLRKDIERAQWFGHDLDPETGVPLL